MLWRMSSPALPLLLLGGREFSVAELTAARLDGELLAVGDGFAPVGAPVDSRHRAAALLADVPPGYTVVGRSAAWLHGAGGRCPVPVEIGGSGPSARWERPYRSVRTMRIRRDQRLTIPVGGLELSTLSPIGTAVDLARIGETAEDADLLAAVMHRCALDQLSIDAVLATWTHLPGKREVSRRLEEALVSRR